MRAPAAAAPKALAQRRAARPSQCSAFSASLSAGLSMSFSCVQPYRHFTSAARVSASKKFFSMMPFHKTAFRQLRKPGDSRLIKKRRPGTSPGLSFQMNRQPATRRGTSVPTESRGDLRFQSLGYPEIHPACFVPDRRCLGPPDSGRCSRTGFG